MWELEECANRAKCREGQFSRTTAAEIYQAFRVQNPTHGVSSAVMWKGQGIGGSTPRFWTPTTPAPPPTNRWPETPLGGGGVLGGAMGGGDGWMDGWMVREFGGQLPGTQAKSSDPSQSSQQSFLNLGLAGPWNLGSCMIELMTRQLMVGKLWAAQAPLDCCRTSGHSNHPAPWVLRGIWEG